MGENVIFCNWSKMLEEIAMVPTAHLQESVRQWQDYLTAEKQGGSSKRIRLPVYYSQSSLQRTLRHNGRYMLHRYG